MYSDVPSVILSSWSWALVRIPLEFCRYPYIKAEEISLSLYESSPTTMHLEGPFTEQSNPVNRGYDAKYHTCFLRVSSLDGAHLHYRFDREVNDRKFIQSRLGPHLYDGLNVAGQRLEFLAYSQSALKDHAVW
jgi:hypothetical protein